MRAGRSIPAPWLAAVAGLGALAGAPARAAYQPSAGDDLAIGAAAVVAGALPSEIGGFARAGGADLVLGWSWQLPVSGDSRHRVLGGVDWISPFDDNHGRARLGYRYGRKRGFAGLAISYAATGASWSPEGGVRFGIDGRPAGHVLVRAEIPLAFGGFGGVSLLLGWDLL